MSVSVASSQFTDGGKSEKDGQKTVASENSASSNRVMVEQIFPQHDRQTVCLLPGSVDNLASPLSGHCCTAKIYTFDLGKQIFCDSSELELSAYLTEIDTNGNFMVELCCAPIETRRNNNTKSYFRFEFEDEIRKVQLMPLPLSTSLRKEAACTSHTASHAVGALLVVISKRAGMSVHSIILSRKSLKDPFHISEFVKVSRGTVEDTGPLVELDLYLDITRGEDGNAHDMPDPVLYAAVLPLHTKARSHRIDALACPLVSHKSALFRFDTRGPTRALKRSLVLTGVGLAKGVSIVARRVSGLPRCTLAALFDQEVKIICLPSLDKWNKQVLRPEDISTVLLDEHGLGSPVVAVPMLCEERKKASVVKFAVLCRPKEMVERKVADEPERLLSPLTYELSPDSTDAGREGPPPQWTAEATKNAVLRARRDIMTNIQQTFYGEDVSKRSLRIHGDEPLCPQTPQRKRTSSSGESKVLDENFDVTIASPDTAILDMSGKYLSRNPSDSMLSSLAGLQFAGQDDDSTVYSFRSNDRSIQPNQPRSSRQTGESAKQACLLVMSLDSQSKSANVLETCLHPIPLTFSISTQAVAIKNTTSGLILAANVLGSSKVQLLRSKISTRKVEPNDEMFTFEVVRPDQFSVSQMIGQVRGIDMDSKSDGGIRIRLLTTMSAKKGPSGPDELGEFNVFAQTISASKPSPLEEEQVKEPIDHRQASSVEDKLDRILNALMSFESRVNERLDAMEETLIETSDRLSRLEQRSDTMVEI